MSTLAEALSGLTMSIPRLVVNLPGFESNVKRLYCHELRLGPPELSWEADGSGGAAVHLELRLEHIRCVAPSVTLRQHGFPWIYMGAGAVGALTIVVEDAVAALTLRVAAPAAGEAWPTSVLLETTEPCIAIGSSSLHSTGTDILLSTVFRPMILSAITDNLVSQACRASCRCPHRAPCRQDI